MLEPRRRHPVQDEEGRHQERVPVGHHARALGVEAGAVLDRVGAALERLPDAVGGVRVDRHPHAQPVRLVDQDLELVRRPL